MWSDCQECGAGESAKTGKITEEKQAEQRECIKIVPLPWGLFLNQTLLTSDVHLVTVYD